MDPPNYPQHVFSNRFALLAAREYGMQVYEFSHKQNWVADPGQGSTVCTASSTGYFEPLPAANALDFKSVM
jgi:hypothetical protein